MLRLPGIYAYSAEFSESKGLSKEAGRDGYAIVGYGGWELEVLVGATGAEEGWSVTNGGVMDFKDTSNGVLVYDEWHDHTPGHFHEKLAKDSAVIGAVKMHTDTLVGGVVLEQWHLLSS